jgi:hypothetical protein
MCKYRNTVSSESLRRITFQAAVRLSIVADQRATPDILSTVGESVNTASTSKAPTIFGPMTVSQPAERLSGRSFAQRFRPVTYGLEDNSNSSRQLFCG